MNNLKVDDLIKNQELVDISECYFFVENDYETFLEEFNKIFKPSGLVSFLIGQLCNAYANLPLCDYMIIRNEFNQLIKPSKLMGSSIDYLCRTYKELEEERNVVYDKNYSLEQVVAIGHYFNLIAKS